MISLEQHLIHWALSTTVAGVAECLCWAFPCLQEIFPWLLIPLGIYAYWFIDDVPIVYARRSRRSRQYHVIATGCLLVSLSAAADFVAEHYRLSDVWSKVIVRSFVHMMLNLFVLGISEPIRQNVCGFFNFGIPLLSFTDFMVVEQCLCCKLVHISSFATARSKDSLVYPTVMV